jgi:hypothetical protein
MANRVRKAIFPVGGMGTRFLPATKAMPKEMLPVVDRPLIQYAVDEARAAGIEQFIFVTGRGKSAIEDHFDHSVELEALLQARSKLDALADLRETLLPPGDIAYVRQQEPGLLPAARSTSRSGCPGGRCRSTRPGQHLRVLLPPQDARPALSFPNRPFGMSAQECSWCLLTGPDAVCLFGWRIVLTGA